jgi:hypothetical protein
VTSSSKSYTLFSGPKIPGHYIEFFEDDGKTFNEQTVTMDIVRSMPTACFLTLKCVKDGRDATLALMEELDGRTAE